ncbi:hypothetical protein GW820_06410 [archaeon]|nr:hypothetical protein [archaeon]
MLKFPNQPNQPNSENVKFSEKTPLNIVNKNISKKLYIYNSEIKHIESGVLTDCINFNTSVSAYFNISSQLTLKALTDGNINCIQFGISNENHEDYDEIFNSTVLNSVMAENDTISLNLSSFKLLNKNEKYVLWCIYSGDCEVEINDFTNVKILQI